MCLKKHSNALFIKGSECNTALLLMSLLLYFWLELELLTVEYLTQFIYQITFLKRLVFLYFTILVTKIVFICLSPRAHPFIVDWPIKCSAKHNVFLNRFKVSFSKSSFGIHLNNISPSLFNRIEEIIVWIFPV